MTQIIKLAGKSKRVELGEKHRAARHVVFNCRSSHQGNIRTPQLEAVNITVALASLRSGRRLLWPGYFAWATRPIMHERAARRVPSRKSGASR
jgi:hypothetical protein